MKNNNTLGLVFSDNSEANLGELMKVRSLAAVPVGGRYRIVDFILSNMVNSGIVSVGITTADKNRSLRDHLGSGKTWDMARKQNGLFVIPPNEGPEASKVQTGELDFINLAMSYLKRSKQEYVLVCDCNTICNIAFNDVIDFHFQKNADITVVCAEVGELSSKDLKKSVLLKVDDDSRVVDFEVYPKKQKSELSYMNMFLIKKDFLIDLVDESLAHDRHSICKDIFLENMAKIGIYAYKFNGFQKKIDSIDSFYQFNLELLSENVRREIFGNCEERSIHTKVKDSVPTKYGNKAEVKNSFVADGCLIDGMVENSIIFRGVKVGKGAVVRNSIIMQNSRIMDGCRVENAIFDKEVILCNGKKMIGQMTYPLCVGKKTII